MAQRKKRTRRTTDDFEMPLDEVIALLLPAHNQQPGDEWTFFVREGVVEMVVTRVPEVIPP